MPPILIILIIVIALILIASIVVTPLTKTQAIDNFIKVIHEKYPQFVINKIQNKTYDLELVYHDIKYLIKFVTIPKNSDVQINNKTTYQVFYGGSNKPGQAKPYNQYLNEVINFINLETVEHKIIIFTPTPREINKYINENEMITVKRDTDVYGLNLLKDNDLSYFKNMIESEIAYEENN